MTTWADFHEDDVQHSRSLSEIMGMYRAMEVPFLHKALTTGTLHLLAIARALEEKESTGKGDK